MTTTPEPAPELPGMRDLGPREQRVRFRLPEGGEAVCYFYDQSRFEVFRMADGSASYTALIHKPGVATHYGQDVCTRRQAAAHLGIWRRKCKQLEGPCAS